MKPPLLARFAPILLLLSIACEGRKKSTFQLPPDLGKGLTPDDSLRAVLNYLEGRREYQAETLRFHYMYEYIRTLARQKPDTLPALTQELRSWAQKSKYLLGEGVAALGEAVRWRSQGQYDSALSRAQTALRIFQEKERSDYEGKTQNLIGVIHYAQGQYAEALEAYQKALALYEHTGDSWRMATCYNSIGNIHADQGRYAEALESYQKALTILERIGNQEGMATLYNNIGTIYEGQRRYTEALEAYQKALAIRERIGDQQGIATCRNNIGNIYLAQGRYAQALEAYQKALAIYEHLGNQQRIAVCYQNISSIYIEQQQYAKALEALQKALAIQERINDQQRIVISYINIGNLYQAQGLYPIARSYFQKALPIAQSLGLQDELDDIYLNLAQTDSALAASGLTHLWKSAYLHHRLYAAYKDSVRNEESIRKQAQLESQYEYDKKISLLKAQQEKERALAQAQFQRQKAERNALLAILAVVLLALSTMAYFQILLRRKNRLIQEQAQELQQKNAELQSINQALIESNKIIQAQAEELIAKNSELTTLNAELEATNKALSESYLTIQQQAKELAQKNEEILDSIRYAERIQRAILPSHEKWLRLLPNSFLFYQPKDIVAGDFYWLEETDHYIFLAVADATGHGVPGAFVSLVCASALNQALQQEGLNSPAAILTRAKTIVTQVLTQEGAHLRDGMDIALIRLEKNTPARLTYAGANRPLWIVSSQKELIEIPPTRQPIGFTDTEKPFEEHEIDLSSRLPAMLYAFTDGFIDQVGGPKGRKLMSKGLREILLEISHKPCPEQEEHLQRFFTAWKGEWPQLDDVTFIGVRLG